VFCVLCVFGPGLMPAELMKKVLIRFNPRESKRKASNQKVGTWSMYVHVHC
jgi:hypothetical protein